MVMHTISHTTNTLTAYHVGNTADVPAGNVLIEGAGIHEHFDTRGRGDGVVRKGRGIKTRRLDNERERAHHITHKLTHSLPYMLVTLLTSQEEMSWLKA